VPATDIIDVFIAGALPGLLLTLVLWVARPGVFDRRLRRRLIGVSLAGSAVVATIPLMTAGF
jgi:TRAP-type C4-dicarboxylate transport system permease large subunit